MKNLFHLQKPKLVPFFILFFFMFVQNSQGQGNAFIYGDKLPDGVYFYVLKCFGAESDEVYKGSVSIYGSGR